MTAIVLLLTRLERFILANHRRRTLASNARHLPPNPNSSGAVTTRRNPK